MQILGSILVLIIVLTILLAQNWRTGAIMGAYVVGATAGLVGLRRIGVRQWKETRQASGELFGFMEETLSGVEDIHSSNGKGFIINWLYRLTRTMLGRHVRAAMRSNLLINGWIFVDTVSYAVRLALGAWLFLRGSASIGAAYLVLHYSGVLSRPLRTVVFQMEDLQKAAAAASRASDLLSLRPTLRPGGKHSLNDGPLSIELDSVTFGYDPSRPVLSDVTIAVPPGAVLGLIGRTGSGKTTISRLLFRLYDVDKGEVRVGGSDVRKIPMGKLRSRIAMVNQRVDLVHGSVRDNLTLYDDTIDDAIVESVVDEIGLGHWLRGLKAGVHTELRGGEAELSAGQAQLLAFARAFVLSKDHHSKASPGVVILDEASSRLDPASEGLLEHAVDRLVAGRTAVIIAHRLSTVMRADWLALIEDGRIVEQGERDRLVKNPRSHVSRLIREANEGLLA